MAKNGDVLIPFCVVDEVRGQNTDPINCLCDLVAVDPN